MKKQLILLTLFFLYSTAFSGVPDAANSGIQNNETKVIEDNNLSEESTIVFMRSTFTGSLIKASIYEITDGNTKFLGILKNKKRIDYKTTAGKHTFMVVAESADFMEAEIVSGKTYYSEITPRIGVWKARFSMYPIRNDNNNIDSIGSKKFKKLIQKTQLVLSTEESDKWYKKHVKKIEQKKSKYWKKWLKKSADYISERTLNIEDGI